LIGGNTLMSADILHPPEIRKEKTKMELSEQLAVMLVNLAKGMVIGITDIATRDKNTLSGMTDKERIDHTMKLVDDLITISLMTKVKEMVKHRMSESINIKISGGEPDMGDVLRQSMDATMETVRWSVEEAE